ncbi:MAG: hypothetical protein IPO91_34375 [Chloroflexi bacterium]|nr:hypothetical protein [Chloroflexota bacterium]
MNRHLNHESSKAELQQEIDRLRSNLDGANKVIKWQRDYIEYANEIILKGAIPIPYTSWLAIQQREKSD